ncbi:hypothetical protein K435DRAFT_837131 [Dendrothele bispora CBS 962.96]|uniref:Uncharacterized protein n=1 Tax=Dendrothele bispora (strain CBS 962.96) TaxID=1314807 RepID=A0A4V4HGZ5_DENBC|nr:hypothetical protein K435DRAFT_837131 [Dendrothele bispora CBS 962.96]
MYPRVHCRLLYPLHPMFIDTGNFTCPFPKTPSSSIPCGCQLPEPSADAFQVHLNHAHSNWWAMRTVKCRCGCSSGPIKTDLFIQHVLLHKFHLQDLICRLCGATELGMDRFCGHLTRCPKLYLFRLEESEWRPYKKVKPSPSGGKRGRRPKSPKA